jgi:hypothetical protein
VGELMDFQDLVKKIKEEFPDKAIDIIESLELLRVVINDTVEAVGNKINSYFSNKQYDKIPYYSSMAQDIGVCEKKIEEIISTIDVDEFSVEEETDEEAEVKTIPNYSEYTVDHNTEHTLYENFTYKRPFGYKLNDQNIVEVKTWQDMLINTCEYLIEIDEKKFMDFENKKTMNGKKNKYFSTNTDDMRKPRKVAGKIYVEINQSGNAIRNLIIKMLKEYNFSIDEFKVYFRADYTSLNDK